MDGMSDDDSLSATIYEQYAFVFLYLVAAATVGIGITSWSFRFSTYLRLRAKAQHGLRHRRTSAIFVLISVVREICYIQLKVPVIGHLPNLGTLLFFLGYTVILLGCLLSNVWAPVPIFWEAIAMRSAYLSVAQLPLLIILSTKKNLVAYVFNSSHERLIIYHQFLGVCLLLTTTLHMGYFLKEWLFYDVWKSQWKAMGMSMLRWGFAAWGLLLFLVATSLSLLRKHFYDSWLMLHLASMLAFFIMLILHLDPPYRRWGYIPLSFWVLDRCWRAFDQTRLNGITTNLKWFPTEVTVEPLQGDVVRLTIVDFPLKRQPGQYLYLSVYKLGLNSHPFTIISKTESKDLTLLVKAKHGLTRRLLRAGSDLLPPNRLSLRCGIDGPYGGTQTRMQSFASVILISGGAGGTYTINLLQDLVSKPGCCRKIIYLWAIRAECHSTWFSAILTECKKLALCNGVELQVLVFVTRETDLVVEETPPIDVACRSSKCLCSKGTLEKEDSIVSSQSSTASHIDSTSLISKSQCCCATKSDDSKSLTLFSGRPDFHHYITAVARTAPGETGIAVCGPNALTSAVRNTVVMVSDELAVKKGTGFEAIYLHVESQS